MLIPKIGIVLNWRNQVNKSNAYSIHLRVKIGDEARYFKIETPIKITLEQWAGVEDGWVKQSHPYYFEINNKIREKKTVVLDLIKRFYNLGKNLDFQTIFKCLRQKGDHRSFLEFFSSYIQDPPEKLELNTIKKYHTCLIHLREFKPKVCFNDICPLFLQSFVKYLVEKKKLESASAKKYLDALKKVIQQARKEGFLDPSQMEFLYDEVKLSSRRTNDRIFLTPDEIRAWRMVALEGKYQHLQKVRDLFLFQIYTGYYYKDLAAFTKSQLINDAEYGLMILGSRDKNNNQTIVPLYKFPYASEIIEKYKSNSEAELVFDKKYLIEEQVYNRSLKEVAKMCKISKNVSNRVARHSNAQLWIRFGAERPVISKMLGHTKEETTRNYFEVNLPEIFEGTKRADFAQMGI